jgi:hypothetical protein
MTEIRFSTEPAPDLDRAGRNEEWRVGIGESPWISFAIGTASLLALGSAVDRWFLPANLPILRLLVALGFAVYWLTHVVPVVVYPRLKRDLAWGRWSAARRKARFLRWTNSLVRKRTLAVAYAFDEAAALAGAGRLSAALALVAPLEGSSVEERSHHLGMLVGVHERARDFDGALRVGERCAELTPDKPTVWLDLAMRHAVRFHDPTRAREMLARMGDAELSAVASAFRCWVLGIVLLEEGHHDQARTELDRAIAMYARFPILSTTLPALRAHRAWAMSATDPTTARAELARVRPQLRQGDPTLLEHVDRALRTASG